MTPKLINPEQAWTKTLELQAILLDLRQKFDTPWKDARHVKEWLFNQNICTLEFTMEVAAHLEEKLKEIKNILEKEK